MKGINFMEIVDMSRYLICPYTNKMFFIHTASSEAWAYCPNCKRRHNFSRRNKAMGGMEYGKENNAWVETW